MYNPEKDGIDHINVYSKGKTELGRFLSNFSECNLTLPEGKFKSIEGYWYYLNTDHEDKELLMNLYGWEAKKVGRELGASDWNSDKLFKSKIKLAIAQKLLNNSNFLNKLIDCKLPLVHYYTYKDKVVVPKDGEWILNFISSFKEN